MLCQNGQATVLEIRAQALKKFAHGIIGTHFSEFDMARTPARAWQRMLSGRRLDILDPSPMDIELGDIAHGLARVARWNGQTHGDYPFSVAQHSVLVLALFEALNPDATASSQLHALLHDASEYVMGDIISPFKAAMGGDYKNVENRLLGAIYIRFSLPSAPSQTIARNIKKADKDAAYFEAVNLAGFSPEEGRKYFGEPNLAGFDVQNFDRLIRPWPTQTAYDEFVAAFDRISTDVNS